LAGVLTGERFRLLRHVPASLTPSTAALARSLDRQYHCGRADVTEPEQTGLPERSTDGLRTTAGRIGAGIWLWRAVARRSAVG
jgi:predicted transcriptional regulator